jgi:glucans biosynthesis protein C
VLDRHPNALMTMSERYGFNMILGCMGALISFGLEQHFLLQVDHPFRWLAKSIALFIYALGSVSLSLGFIGLFTKKFTKENKVWRYISDASYWIYLTHLPVVFYLQAKLAPFLWSWWIKLSITSVTTFVVLTITYQLGVRYMFIGRILNSKRKI